MNDYLKCVPPILCFIFWLSHSDVVLCMMCIRDRYEYSLVSLPLWYPYAHKWRNTWYLHIKPSYIMTVFVERFLTTNLRLSWLYLRHKIRGDKNIWKLTEWILRCILILLFIYIIYFSLFFVTHFPVYPLPNIIWRLLYLQFILRVILNFSFNLLFFWWFFSKESFNLCFVLENSIDVIFIRLKLFLAAARLNFQVRKYYTSR